MKPIKLGIMLGYSGPQLNIPIERIKLAEELGFDSIWTAEAYGSDAITPLAYIAAHTNRIRLGTAIMQMAGRTPAMAAMQAATVDQLAGGNRVIAGIGMSGPQIVEGWYGMPWGKPYHWMKDYITIMRKVFAREAPVSHDGQQWPLPLPADRPGAMGIGKPLRSILHPNPDIPIWTGSGTELMVKLTAELADGWLPLGWTPRGKEIYGDWLQAGFDKAGNGKSFDNFEIQAGIGVIITDDVKAGIDSFKPGIALYAGGMGHKNKNFHKDRMIKFGYKDAAEKIQELYLSGRKDEAAAAVPDEYVDEQNLIGSTDRIRQNWAAWADSGCTGLNISTKQDEAVQLMAELADTRGQLADAQ